MTNALSSLNWRLFATVFRASYETITPPPQQAQSGKKLERPLGLDEGYQHVKDPLLELHDKCFSHGGGAGSSKPVVEILIDLSPLANVQAKPHPYAGQRVRTSDHIGTLSAEPTHIVCDTKNGQRIWTLCYSTLAQNGHPVLYPYIESPNPIPNMDEIPLDSLLAVANQRGWDASVDKSGSIILRKRGAAPVPWVMANHESHTAKKALIASFTTANPLDSYRYGSNSWTYPQRALTIDLKILKSRATAGENAALTTEALLKAATQSPDSHISQNFLKLIEAIHQRT